MLTDLNENTYKIGMLMGWLLLIASVIIFLSQSLCPQESCYWYVGYSSIFVFGISLLIIFGLLLQTAKLMSGIQQRRPVLGTVILLLSTGIILSLLPVLSSLITYGLGDPSSYLVILVFTPVICAALTGEYLGIKLIDVKIIR